MGFRLIWKKSQPRKHNRSQSSQLMTWSISRIRKLFLPFKINPSTSGGLGSGRKQKLFISQLHFALPLSPDSGMYVANARAISCAENSTRHLSPDVNTKMTDPQDFPQSATPPPPFFSHITHAQQHTPSSLRILIRFVPRTQVPVLNTVSKLFCWFGEWIKATELRWLRGLL